MSVWIVFVCVAFSASSSVAAEDGLVAHWKFDEASGDKLADASGNGNDGKITGPEWGKGISGGALEFDGVDDYVVIPKSASLNSPDKEITVSAWIKTPLPDRHTILARWMYEDDANDRSLLLEVRGDKKVASFALSPDGGGSVWCNCPENVVPKDEWTHIVGVGDGRTMRVYINGKQCASLDDAAYRVFAAKGDLYMGIWKFGKDKQSGQFKGLIDEVKIYSRAMNADEVLKFYGDFGPKGTVSGKVADAKGKAIGGATVSIGLFTTTTGADGAYSLSVPPGQYTVEITKVGHTRQVIDVQIEKDKTTTAAKVSLTEDKVAPKISNISVRSPSGSVAVIEWETDECCAGTANYGTSAGKHDKFVGIGPSYTKSHRAILSGLEPKTKYYFVVSSVDEAGNVVRSSESAFTTPSDHAEKDLVAYWKFDAGKGDMIFDASGNKNHGYVHGPAEWVKGRVAGGLKFDGKGSYIRIRKSPSLDSPEKEITLTTWVKSPLTQRGTIFGRWFYYRKKLGGQRGIELDIDSAKASVNFALSSDGSASSWCASSNQVIPKDEWVHIAAVSDGATMKYYFNGREDIFTAEATPKIHPSATDLFIGAWYANGRFSCLFDGVIDEARIYSRALSGDEILEIYADTCTKGTVSGMVSSGGKPVTQTKVSVGLFSAITGDDGAFTLDVPVGEYQVIVARKGYKTYTGNVESVANKSAVARIRLVEDETGPEITKINAEKTANYTALIEWETDERAISTVSYGTSAGKYVLKTKEPSPVKFHRVLLTGLKPGMKYHFAVDCIDEAGNTSKSEDFSFTTKKLPEMLTWSTKPGPRDKDIGPDIPLSPQEMKGLANRITVKGFTTADVQSACDKAAADGVPVVYLPAGEYVIKGVNIPAGLTLLGAGSKTYISSVKNGQIFQAIGDGVRLTRMKLYGMNPTPANVSDSCCLRAFGVKNIRVDHCEVMAFARALYFGKGAIGQVDHCIIHHNCWSGLGYGVISVNDGTMVLVTDNIFHSNRHTVTSNYGEAHYLFRYNHILDVKDCAPGDNLSQCDVHPGLTPKGAFVVEYNIFENCKGALGCWAGRGVVRGNVFRNLYYAINVTSKVPHEIGDNTFEKVRRPYMGAVSGKSKMPDLMTVPYMLEMDQTGVIQVFEKDTTAYYTGTGKALREKVR